ncbi:hypothetical protein L584_00555 [Pantoea agglomerans Tx10]|nr:hypothetical protein L584_00555 [Pantoea agglomerans Tx10]
MKSHDPKRIVYAPARQYWRAFVYVMQVHENHCIKRAGVAGLRARAERLNRIKKELFLLMFNGLSLKLNYYH